MFADAGITDDVLLTYNILGRQKTDRLMALVKRVRRLTVVLDNDVVARGLSEAAARPASTCASWSNAIPDSAGRAYRRRDEAFALARTAMRLPRMHFEGLMTFPNRDPDTRDFFERALALFKQAGIPVPVVSGGGTPALFTAQNFPMLTEHRAGTCVYNDAMVVVDRHRHLGRLRDAREGDGRQSADAHARDHRRRVQGAHVGPLLMKGYGHVMEYSEAAVTGLSEEHGTVDLSACAERPKVGDVVHVVPNHCCVVTNMVDEVYGVRNGAVEVAWPVAARGKVR